MTSAARTEVIETDVLVMGGGTGGPMAAVKAKEGNPALRVLLLEKANVKRSGAISMGMDGLNNAVIPGHATPEQYVKEITVANDGIVDQKAVMAYAQDSFAMIEELDRWGVKFEKDETGEYTVRKVHHMGSYVLPMPEGHDIKKVLYRQLERLRVEITNRFVATRLLTAADGRIAGAMGFDCRTGEFHVIRAKAVVLACGAAGRLGLPASGYLFGTYENPTNAGDGYAMAYHAGAELANLECFQINPLIKDYNGPACAYVTGPFGGYTANNRGQRFIECDYWCGQMMLEFYHELQGGKGPVFLKLDHLAEETIGEIETILHTNERPQPRPLPRAAAATTTASAWSRCTSPRSASAAATAPRACGWTSTPRRPSPACTPPATWPACRTTTCSAPSSTAARRRDRGRLLRRDRSARARRRRDRGRAARVLAPPLREDGLPPYQIEYKMRRMVNDYLQPPKVTRKMEIGLERLAEVREDLDQLVRPRSARADARARDPLDPRLRRDGGRGLALSHREPLGPIPPARRLSRDDNDNWFCHSMHTRTPGAASPIASARSRPTSCRSRRTRCPPTTICASRRRLRRSEEGRQCRSPTMQPAFPSSSMTKSASPTRAATSASRSARSTCSPSTRPRARPT